MFDKLLNEVRTQVKCNFCQSTTDVARSWNIIIRMSDVTIEIGRDGVIVQIELKKKIRAH